MSLTIQQQHDFDDLLVILNTLRTTDPEMRELIKSLQLEMQMKNIMSKEDPDVGTSSLKIFKDAVMELKDDLPPLRAFAMSKLRNLIQVKDPIAEENIILITDLFLEQISHEDRLVIF